MGKQAGHIECGLRRASRSAGQFVDKAGHPALQRMGRGLCYRVEHGGSIQVRGIHLTAGVFQRFYQGPQHIGVVSGARQLARRPGTFSHRAPGQLLYCRLLPGCHPLSIVRSPIHGKPGTACTA